MFGSPLLITTVDSIVVLLYGAWKYKAYATSSFDQLQPVFLSTITVSIYVSRMFCLEIKTRFAFLYYY